jgi:hypothetical protein
MIKYKYTFEHIQEHKIVILNLDNSEMKNGDLITNSFGTDITDEFTTIKDTLERYQQVLKSENAQCEDGGNSNFITIRKDFTILQDIFTDEDEDDIVCKIETIEFVKLLLVWAEEVFKYKSQYKIINENEMENASAWIRKEWTWIETYEEKRS